MRPAASRAADVQRPPESAVVLSLHQRLQLLLLVVLRAVIWLMVLRNRIRG